MKFSKVIKGLSFLMLSTFILTACAADGKKETSVSKEKTEQKENAEEKTKIAGADLKDGTYKLEEKNESNGYRAVFEIVVKNGKITESKYDNLDAEGQSKADNKEYNKKMMDAMKTSPEKYIPEFNEALVATQSPESIEVVTGATNSFVSFQNYAQQLIQAAQTGDTNTIEIDNGSELKDGTYTLKEKNDVQGYHTEFKLVVADGKIVESDYDNVNTAGQSKKTDQEYNKKMMDTMKTSPEKYIPEFNQALVEKQTPAEVEVVTGATNSYHSFVLYAQQLVNAAEKGDTNEILVDNIVIESK